MGTRPGLRPWPRDGDNAEMRRMLLGISGKRLLSQMKQRTAEVTEAAQDSTVLELFGSFQFSLTHTIFT